MARTAEGIHLCKVQSDTSGRRALIYNEDRSIFYEATGSEALAVLKGMGMAAHEKAYVMCSISESGKLSMDAETKMEMDQWPEW